MRKLHWIAGLLLACMIWANGPLVAAPSVTLHWKLDDAAGSGTAADSGPDGGRAGIATLNGGADFVPTGGLFGGAVDLNGATGSATDNVATPATGSWIATPSLAGGTNPLGSGDFTISMWVKARSDGVIAHEDASLGGFSQNTWDVSSTGNVKGRVWAFSAANRPDMGTISVDGSEWNHVVLRFDENGAVDTVDGFVDGVASATQGTGNRSAPTPGWAFGAERNQTMQTIDFFDGLMDDLTIYNETLTNAEVGWLFNFGDQFGYDSGLVQELFQLAEDQVGEVEIDGLVWLPFDGTLPPGIMPGEVVEFGSRNIALLDNDLAISSAIVPEPTTLAIWSFLGFVLASLGYYRYRSK